MIIDYRESAAEWRAAGRTFKHRGHNIFAVDSGGQGDALLFIHGFPSASWDWHAQWPVFGANFRLLTLDMIGFGWSDKPAKYDYSIFDQADIFESYLEQLGVTRIHIVAHDYGDTVAQELIARHQDRHSLNQDGLDIKSVVLLNGGLFPETHRARFVQKLLNSPLGFLITNLMTRDKFDRSMRAIFGKHSQPTDALLAVYWELLTYADGHRRMHKLIRYITQRRQNRARWVGALQRTNVPLRLICGAADPVSGAHMAKRYAQLVPNPDIKLLADIGHYPQVEDADAVNAAIAEFLQNHL